MSTGVVATLPLQHQRRGRPPARSNTWLPARAPSRAAVCTCSASSGEGASAVAGAAGTAANCARSHLFVFGASGYTARALAGVLKRSGWRVSGACRGEETREALRAAGVEAHTWDPDDDVPLSRDALDCLRAATHVLSSVPPVGDFDRDPARTPPRAPCAPQLATDCRVVCAEALSWSPPPRRCFNCTAPTSLRLPAGAAARGSAT